MILHSTLNRGGGGGGALSTSFDDCKKYSEAVVALAFIYFLIFNF